VSQYCLGPELGPVDPAVREVLPEGVDDPAVQRGAGRCSNGLVRLNLERGLEDGARPGGVDASEHTCQLSPCG
jgi:hypothetical protein